MLLETEQQEKMRMKKYLAFALTLALLFSFTPRSYAKSESPVFNIDVGDTVYFGRYEQDNDLSNGPEEIPWTVLDWSQDRALVISKYVLDCKTFNDSTPRQIGEIVVCVSG